MKKKKRLVVEREQLLSALDQVSPGLSTRDVVEQASCFVFKDGWVHSFNDEIACSFKVKSLKVEGAVQAAPLMGILSKLKEQTLEYTDSKQELIFQGKGRKAGLVKEHEVQLPLDSIEIPKKWSHLPEDFIEAVEFVQDCVDRDEAKFPLSCIHLHPEYIEAFDNNQFARYSIKLAIKREFLVRQPSLREVIRRGMNEFSQGKEWLHFRNEDGLTISCRSWKDPYKDLNWIIEKSHGHKIVLPSGLVEASGRAEVFAEGNTQDKSRIKFDLTPGLVVLRGEGTFGWFEERKKVKYKGEPFSFWINPGLMVQLLKRQTKCEINGKAIRVEFGEKKEGIFVTSLIPDVKKKDKKKGKK